MTNGDYIRSMTDEELAACLHITDCERIPIFPRHSQCDGDCYNCWLEWLRRPLRSQKPLTTPEDRMRQIQTRED